MSVSILEALQNADYNMQHNGQIGYELHNSVILLEKGYPLNTEIEPLLEEYGDVDNVPEKVM
jgi:hypothetical protein